MSVVINWKTAGRFALLILGGLIAARSVSAQQPESVPILPAPPKSFPQPGVVDAAPSPPLPDYRLESAEASWSENKDYLILRSTTEEKVKPDSVVIVRAGERLDETMLGGLFDKPTAVILVTDCRSLVPTDLVSEETILIYLLPSEYEQAAKSGGGKKEKKFRAYLDCVYADGKTRLEGLWKITAMRINGVPVDDLKAEVDGNEVLFSRKHTKSEVHLFQLLPGQYEVEFAAEATFEGKFFKRGIGRGTFVVVDRNATGKVVFDYDR